MAESSLPQERRACSLRGARLIAAGYRGAVSRRRPSSPSASNRAARTARPSDSTIDLATLPTEAVHTSLSEARLERRDTGILLLLDETESSWIDLADPAYLDFEYQQQMNAAVDVLLPRSDDAALRAVHLGGAGCALARAWEARRPGSTQLAVEIDAILAAKAREWFDLPRSPRLRIRVGDAAEVAPTLRPGEWDVVVRDVFARGQVPTACTSHDFHAACARALAPGGLYLVNLPSLPREAAGRELTVMRRMFDGVAVIADGAHARGKRRGNLVIVARASAFERDEWEQLDRAARRLPLPARLWRVDDPALPREGTLSADDS